MKGFMATGTWMLMAGLATSCGSDAKQSGDSSEEKSEAQATFSVFAATQDALPDCDDTRKTALAYVADEKAMYHCDGEWKKIEEEAPPQSSGIKSVFGYHKPDYKKGAPNISENDTFDIYVGTIQLVEFEDGSGFMTASGTLFGPDLPPQAFSHSFFYAKPAEGKTVEHTAKLGSFADSQIQYQLVLGDAPVVKVSADDDGDFADNEFKEHKLTAN